MTEKVYTFMNFDFHNTVYLNITYFKSKDENIITTQIISNFLPKYQLVLRNS